MFFIDAASFIDVDDDSWRFFFLFEKVSFLKRLKEFMRKILAFPQVKVGGVTRYHTVGYSTVYEYYAYGREVNKKRPRIAQMVQIVVVRSEGLLT